MAKKIKYVTKKEKLYDDPQYKDQIRELAMDYDIFGTHETAPILSFKIKDDDLYTTTTGIILKDSKTVTLADYNLWSSLNNPTPWGRVVRKVFSPKNTLESHIEIGLNENNLFIYVDSTFEMRNINTNKVTTLSISPSVKSFKVKIEPDTEYIGYIVPRQCRGIPLIIVSKKKYSGEKLYEFINDIILGEKYEETVSNLGRKINFKEEVLEIKQDLKDLDTIRPLDKAHDLIKPLIGESLKNGIWKKGCLYYNYKENHFGFLRENNKVLPLFDSIYPLTKEPKIWHEGFRWMNEEEAVEVTSPEKITALEDILPNALPITLDNVIKSKCLYMPEEEYYQWEITLNTGASLKNMISIVAVQVLINEKTKTFMIINSETQTEYICFDDTNLIFRSGCTKRTTDVMRVYRYFDKDGWTITESRQARLKNELSLVYYDDNFMTITHDETIVKKYSNAVKRDPRFGFPETI